MCRLRILSSSISLNTEVTQQSILKELVLLKLDIHGIRKASFASQRSNGHRRTPAVGHRAEVVHSLDEVAEAAERLYTTASSATETSPSEGSTVRRQNFTDTNLSSTTKLPTVRHQLGQRFINDPTATTGLPSPSILASSRPQTRGGAPSTIGGLDDSGAEYQEMDQLYQTDPRDYARESFRCTNYDQATEFLNQALRNSSGREDQVFREIQTLTALCHFFQGNWKQAKPAIMTLARSRADLTTCNLLHALALGYLSEYSFDDALNTCKQALIGKKRLCEHHGVGSSEYTETLALLAEIYKVKGDCAGEEAPRRELGPDLQYVHPKSPASFLQHRTDVLSRALGDDIPLFFRPYPQTDVADSNVDQRRVLAPQVADRERFRESSAIRQRLAEKERYDMDTRKEPVGPLHSPYSAFSTTLRDHLCRFLKLGRSRDRMALRPFPAEKRVVSSLWTNAPSDNSGMVLPWWPSRRRQLQASWGGGRLKRRPPVVTSQPSEAKSTLVPHDMYHVSSHDLKAEWEEIQENCQEAREPVIEYYRPTHMSKSRPENLVDVYLPWPQDTKTKEQDISRHGTASAQHFFRAVSPGIVFDGYDSAISHPLCIDQLCTIREIAGTPKSELPDNSRAELEYSPRTQGASLSGGVALVHYDPLQPAEESQAQSPTQAEQAATSPRGVPVAIVTVEGQASQSCVDSPTLPRSPWNSHRRSLPIEAVAKLSLVPRRSKSTSIPSRISGSVSISSEMAMLLRDISATMTSLNSLSISKAQEVRSSALEALMPRLVALGEDQLALKEVDAQVQSLSSSIRDLQASRGGSDTEPKGDTIRGPTMFPSVAASDTPFMGRPEPALRRALTWASTTASPSSASHRLIVPVPPSETSFHGKTVNPLHPKKASRIPGQPKVRLPPISLAINTSGFAGRGKGIVDDLSEQKSPRTPKEVSVLAGISQSALTPKIEGHSPLSTPLKSAPARVEGWNYWTGFVGNFVTYYFSRAY
jgi:tetratricopeptide (TPR) repeat protein